MNDKTEEDPPKDDDTYYFKEILRKLAEAGSSALEAARKNAKADPDFPRLKLVVPPETVKKLNVRGGRRDVKDTHPGVEYDFVPTILKMDAQDVVHIQFHGLDFNASVGDGNPSAWAMSERSNLIEEFKTGLREHNFPEFKGLNDEAMDKIAETFLKIATDMAGEDKPES